MTINQLNSMDVLEAAKFYMDFGLQLVPVPRKDNHKDPDKKKWELTSFGLPDFAGDPVNIGGKTGGEMGKNLYFADVDGDLKLADGKTAWPGAAELMDEFLPASGFVWGRDTARRMHRGYTTEEPLTTMQFHGVNSKMLIELRSRTKGNKKKPPAVQHSVLPPGVHHSGELIIFDSFDAVQFGITHAPKDFIEFVRRTAVGLLMLQTWPDIGKRHNARLAWSKVLQCKEIPDQEVAKRLVKFVSEWHSRGTSTDAEAAFHDTAGKDPEDTFGAQWINDNLPDGTMKAFNAILGRKRKGSDGAIIINNMDLKSLTPDVWERVRAGDTPPSCFTQGGQPVRAVHIPENAVTDDTGARRPTWVFQHLDHARLTNEVAQHVVFEYAGGSEENPKFTKVAPPRVLITDMLSTRPGKMPLPPVSRITYAPTLALDGQIELKEGYHPSSGTFYVPTPGLVIAPVPDSPGSSDIRKACKILLEPLQDFNWVTGADKLHALSLMLLPFVRTHIIGPTPLYLIRKPVAGAGATLLTDTLLYPSVGTDIAKLTTVGDDDEWRKTITATLLDGPTAIVIDNARHLTSPVLAKAVTDTTWNARILGTARSALLPVETAWVATGINPTLHTEVMRRIVPINIDPGVERPWERTGFTIPELRVWLPQHRGEMIWAALTLAKAWYVHKRVQSPPKSLGMFESWSRIMGMVVSWFQTPDLRGQPLVDGSFLGNLTSMYDDADTESDSYRWLLEQWNAHHKRNEVKIADVSMWALRPGTPMMDVLSGTTDRAVATEFSHKVRSLVGRTFTFGKDAIRIVRVRDQGQSRSHTFKLETSAAPSTPEQRIPF